MATLFPKPGPPEKLLAHGDGTKQDWVAQGFKATNTYHGSHVLDQWSPVPGRKYNGTPVLYPMLAC